MRLTGSNNMLIGPSLNSWVPPLNGVQVVPSVSGDVTYRAGPIDANPVFARCAYIVVPSPMMPL